jgi:AraC-like DNA-binding protein
MILDIQQAIDWIEGHLEDDLSLEAVSETIRYSPSHVSRKFHQYTGSTLRNYIQLRRLTKAAILLRDQQIRILDVAIRFGYQSQEAFTRAFQQTFGITPGEYIRTKRMIPYVFKKDVLFPHNLSKEGDIIVVQDTDIRIKLETTPAHKFVYLAQDGVDNYMDFWAEQERQGKDCDHLHGVLASMPGIFPEGYGAFTEHGYLFGKDCPLDYEVDPSFGFQETILPEQQYLRFEHPGFTEAEFGEALNQVRRIALEAFDFELNGYELDRSFVRAFEHSGMDLCYYFIRIPLRSK